MQNNILMPGDAAGNYDEKWTKTFDLKFFDFMVDFICTFIDYFRSLLFKLIRIKNICNFIEKILF